MDGLIRGKNEMGDGGGRFEDVKETNKLGRIAGEYSLCVYLCV